MVTMVLNGLLRVEGRSCGDESSEWLERVLGISGVHLVRGVRDHNEITMIKSLTHNDQRTFLQCQQCETPR